MKALTIKQPWASLIIYGDKDVENRSWPTSYRGPLLIHAGKGYDVNGDQYIDAPIPLEAGGIIGQVELLDCVQYSNSPWAMKNCYHWLLSSPQCLPYTPLKGQLGLFNVVETALN